MKKLRTVQDKIRGGCVFLVVRKLSYRKPQIFTDINKNPASDQLHWVIFFFFNFWSFVFSFPCKRVQLLELLIIFQFRYSLYPSIKHRIRPKLSNSSKGWRSLPPPLPHVVPGWSVWNCDFPIQGTHYLEHRECTKSSRISQVVPQTTSLFKKEKQKKPSSNSRKDHLQQQQKMKHLEINLTRNMYNLYNKKI